MSSQDDTNDLNFCYDDFLDSSPIPSPERPSSAAAWVTASGNLTRANTPSPIPSPKPTLQSAPAPAPAQVPQQRMAAVSMPILKFSGDPDDPTRPVDFMQEFELRMIKLMTVRLYFPVGSRAAEWYKNMLTDVQRNRSWEDFETLFNAKFPSQEKEQK